MSLVVGNIGIKNTTILFLLVIHILCYEVEIRPRTASKGGGGGGCLQLFLSKMIFNMVFLACSLSKIKTERRETKISFRFDFLLPHLVSRRETCDLEIGHFLIDRMIDQLFY